MTYGAIALPPTVLDECVAVFYGANCEDYVS